MLVNLARVVLVAAGGAGGVQLMIAIRGYWAQDQAGWISALILSILILSGLGYVLGGVIGRAIDRLINRFESTIYNYSTSDIILGSVGLFVGLAIAAMVSLSIRGIQFVGTFGPPLIFIAGGYLGIRIALRRRDELKQAIPFLEKAEQGANGEKGSLTHAFKYAAPKIVDTSVVIDGRLGDVYRTGFLEGDLVVPAFVIDELQALADSRDALKRDKGRRGLELLAGLREELVVRLYDRALSARGVDAQLIEVAKEIDGAILTKDYNLQKVAELNGVRVLNINQLANSVRPILIAGEIFRISVIREGKEPNQGVGYLDDGTMVVVENGKSHVGEDLEVTVTSVIQTSAGRIIFARPAAKIAAPQ